MVSDIDKGYVTPHVSILCDEPCEALKSYLQEEGFSASWQPRLGRQADLSGSQFVVVVSGPCACDSWLEMVEDIAREHPELPILYVALKDGSNEAITAIHAGSFDFKRSAGGIATLLSALEHAATHGLIPHTTYGPPATRRMGRTFAGMIGSSPVFLDLCRLLEQVARSRASVLITGETGTGKEVAARAIHSLSDRKNKAFVPINCAAIPEPLLESDLFGHARGAFTGASNRRQGLLQHAHGGTLFLDEVGDMPIGLQAKLLRVIESRSVRPLGTDEEVPVDVRFIAATHTDLHVATERGTFRDDLLFRLNVIQVDLPPLRARGDDIVILAQHFLDLFSKETNRPPTCLSLPAARKLLDYPWPGNIRELSNCIERALALTPRREIRITDLPANVRDHRGGPRVPERPPLSSIPSLAEVEREHILHVLKVLDGNKAAAARVLKLDRRTIYRKLRQYGIEGAERATESLPRTDYSQSADR